MMIIEESDVQVVEMGEVFVNDSPAEYKVHGVGSCIILFLWDLSSELSMAMHGVRPFHKVYSHFEDCIESLFYDGMDELEEYNSFDSRNFRAGIVGGAQLFDWSYDLGSKNIEKVKELLALEKISIEFEDVGGSASRSVFFNSLTRQVDIQTYDKLTHQNPTI
jgi:chemotaxis receptor (MCP) glutamine deamidase CheD